MELILNHLFQKYPELKSCEHDIVNSFELLEDTYHRDGKVLLAGNGGSAADCDHIVGELMKGFALKRPLQPAVKEQFAHIGESGSYLAEHLQGALPAISLTGHAALLTAFANDVSADLIFAQQVYGYGRPQDTFVGFSTSGESKNVLYAAQVAKTLKMKTIGFTGEGGGQLAEWCDVTIKVPYRITADIQERHLPIYHALCLMLEKTFFEA